MASGLQGQQTLQNAQLLAHLENRFFIDCMALRPLEAFEVTLMVLKGRDVSLSALNMPEFRLEA